MATKKIDLNKLKTEIANEKRGKYATPSNLGEAVGAGAVPRDTFLHGLVTSLDSGTESPSTNLIKVVENTVSSKKDGAPIHNINETRVAPQQPQQPEVRKKIDMSPERDEQLFADIEAKRQQTLAESIQNFNAANTTAPTNPVVNYNGQQLLTSIPQTAPAVAPVAGTTQINEAVLIESVQQIVNSHLQQNLGPIFDEAIKGTIIEMYAIERIKSVLNENRDLIKDVVIQTIREIQTKNKAKKAGN